MEIAALIYFSFLYDKHGLLSLFLLGAWAFLLLFQLSLKVWGIEPFYYECVSFYEPGQRIGGLKDGSESLWDNHYSIFIDL